MSNEGFLRKQLVSASVTCVLVFQELQVLPPEMVMHIVSFLSYWECKVCGKVVTDDFWIYHRFLCDLRQNARKAREEANAEVIRVILGQ